MMASTTQTWVSLGENGKVIRASRSIFLHLHVNISFIKALEQVPTDAKSIIGFAHNQGKELGRMRLQSLDHRPRVRLKTLKKRS